MATIKSPGVDVTSGVDVNIGTGILMPLFQHRWRIVLEIDKEDSDLVSKQAVKCAIDYSKNEFTLFIQQDIASAHLHTICRDLCKPHEMTSIQIHAMAGDETVNIVKFMGCSVKEHRFELDYASSDIAYHKLVFKIGSIIPYERFTI